MYDTWTLTDSSSSFLCSLQSWALGSFIGWLILGPKQTEPTLLVVPPQSPHPFLSSLLPPCVHLSHPPVMCPPQWAVIDQWLQTNWVTRNTKLWPPACYKCSLVIVRPSRRRWNVSLKDVCIVLFCVWVTEQYSFSFSHTFSQRSLLLVPLLMKPSLHNSQAFHRDFQTIIKAVI